MASFQLVMRVLEKGNPIEKGSVKFKGYEDWFLVRGADFSVDQPATSFFDIASSESSPSSAQQNDTSIELIGDAAGDLAVEVEKRFAKPVTVELHYIRQQAKGDTAEPEAFMKVTLEKAYFQSVGIVENQITLGLHYEVIKMEMAKVDADNNIAGTALSVGFDFELGQEAKA